MKNDLFETLNRKIIYRVPTHNRPIHGTVEVPGSKSMTNRALLIAALAKGKSILTGVLFSDDSRHFLSCLMDLGFDVTMDEPNKKVTIIGLNGAIPKLGATINVGSAGTAARFLTAMLALSNGAHTILCSDQMKRRPMKPLFDALTSMGASFEYLEKPGFLPVRVKGNRGLCQDVSMEINQSTQFLSALLLVAPMATDKMIVHIVGDKKEGAYISITRHMMAQFNVTTSFDGASYCVDKNNTYTPNNYHIEPDMSAACYFYAMATLTGGRVTVTGVTEDLIQGDIKFLTVLKDFGSTIRPTKMGLEVKGPKDGLYSGIDVDLNDFSDQSMTLACLAAYATSPTVIRNVAHIRLQECDRMKAIVDELTKVGIKCEADGQDITITPKPMHGASISTYHDHRMAMAFTLLGLKTDGMIIENPSCCKKTFENYFHVITSLLMATK